MPTPSWAGSRLFLHCRWQRQLVELALLKSLQYAYSMGLRKQP